jgi:hypothetical protein
MQTCTKVPAKNRSLPKKHTFMLAGPEVAVNTQIAPRGDEAV